MKRRYDEEIFYLTGCDVHQYARFDGALVAQQILRHKTQKRSFRLMFWLTVFSNFSNHFWGTVPHRLHLFIVHVDGLSLIQRIFELHLSDPLALCLSRVLFLVYK